MCIGREVVFRVDYSVPSIGRDFGSVFVRANTESGQENVACSVVAAGWARVRNAPAGASDVSPDYAELIRLQEQATEAGIGVFGKETAAKAVREMPTDPLNTEALLESHKGQAVPGLVEYVVNGGTVRVTLLDNFHTITIFVAGIQCPSMGRRGPAPAAGANGNGATGQVAASAEPVPEPYAREAKHFCECMVLHREIRVVLEGVDKYQNLFGTLFKPDSDSPVDLADQLLRLGLAKTADWSMSMLSHAATEKLRLAERSAKDARLRIWRDYTPPPKVSSSLSSNFTGKVLEIISGDLLVVVDAATDMERRVCLASVRSPKVGNPRRDIKPEPYGPEAKEFLRQRLVGKTVKVAIDYSRKVVMAGEAGDSSVDRSMDFGSVTLTDPSTAAALADKSEEPAGQCPNLGEMLVLRGLATVVRHRGDEERASNYDALMQAEAKAQKNKKGMHSAKESPVNHINDLSLREAAHKARQYLPFLQRGGRLHAVVEVVLSGHRMKLYIPKENVMVVFSLAGVRAPGRVKDTVEPFADEALAFTRRRCLQHDVEVEVENVDKTGTFLGTLHLNGGRVNLGQAILESGLASLHPMFNPERAVNGHELKQCETRAKEARLKMWANYDPSKEMDLAGNGEASSRGGNAEVWEVVVTEVRDGGELYVQRKEKTQSVDWLADQLAGLGLMEQPATGGVGYKPSPGTVCCARFSEDNQWYRAKVEKLSGGNAEVFYLDFGNLETLPLSKLATLDSPSLTVAALPPLAQSVSLAGLKVPSLEEDFGYEAGEMLSELTIGKTLRAKIEDREKVDGKRGAENLLVTLSDPGATGGISVNASMVKAGLARCVRPRNQRIGAVVDSLKKFQEAARGSRANMWQYGDIDSDEDL